MRNVRTSAVDVLRVIAIPAEKLQIRGESELDYQRIPCAASSPKTPFVLASRVMIAATVDVVNGEKLNRQFSATLTLISVVSEHNQFSLCALAPLPVAPVARRYGFCIGPLDVRPRFNSARSTQRLALSFPSALITNAGISSRLKPSISPSVAFRAPGFPAGCWLAALHTESAQFPILIVMAHRTHLISSADECVVYPVRLNV